MDYEDTFAPVSRLTSVQTLLVVIATTKNWNLFQMDVKNAFINGDTSEEIYMRSPLGFSILTEKVCHLRWALYGLKQAP